MEYQCSCHLNLTVCVFQIETSSYNFHQKHSADSLSPSRQVKAQSPSWPLSGRSPQLQPPPKQEQRGGQMEVRRWGRRNKREAKRQWGECKETSLKLMEVIVNLLQVWMCVVVFHLWTGAIGAVGCLIEELMKYRPGFTFSLWKHHNQQERE